MTELVSDACVDALTVQWFVSSRLQCCSSDHTHAMHGSSKKSDHTDSCACVALSTDSARRTYIHNCLQSSVLSQV